MFSYILTAVISIGSTLGLGKLWQLYTVRKWKTQDINTRGNHDVQIRQIDASMEAFKTVSARLEIVEQRLEQLTTQHTAQMIINERLKLENESHQSEIQRLRQRELNLTSKVEELNKLVDMLRREILMLRTGAANNS